MPTFGKRGFRVRTFRRGKIWYMIWYHAQGRQIRQSLDTLDELEATAAAIQKSENLQRYGRIPAKRGVLVLYVIQRGDDGPIKVGISTDIMRRMAQLKNAIPEPIRILAVYRMNDIEKAMHKHLKEFEIDGEWFKPEAWGQLQWILFPPYKPQKILRVVKG